jgi:very-long-chain (3R)-3-hydroxyacyl-CoA dehydratase
VYSPFYIFLSSGHTRDGGDSQLTRAGLVKSPVSTTAIQVCTRTIQVWMIWYCFPASTASSSAFAVLVLTWGAADAIRYAYLALHLHGRAPALLVWLR